MQGAAALANDVEAALKRQAPLFLGMQDVTNLLTRASAEMPDVVKETPIARDTTQTSSAIATKQIRFARTSLARR